MMKSYSGARIASMALLLAAAAATVSAECTTGTEVGPCMCLMSADNSSLSVHCSNVTDGADVKSALEQIKADYILSLDISESPELKTLVDDTFGDTSVQNFGIQSTGLQNIAASVFGDATSKSLKTLYIKYNSAFTDFDSDMLSSLPSLEELYISNTALDILSEPLPETALRYADFSHNAILLVATDYFAKANKLEDVILSFNNLTVDSLPDNQQEFVENLYVDFSWNGLRNGTYPMTFTKAPPRELILSGNGINYLTEKAFSGLVDQMAEQYPEENPYILLDKNPLLCGCEVAWTVTHPHREILSNAMCRNGQLLVNLTPAYFVDC